MSTLYNTTSVTPVRWSGNKRILKSSKFTNLLLNTLTPNVFNTIAASPSGAIHPDATLDSDGKITVNYNGVIRIDISFKSGRGNTGDGALYYYLSINGLAPSITPEADNRPTLLARVDDGENYLDFNRSRDINISVGDTLEAQLSVDTGGGLSNDWELWAQTWSASPGAQQLAAYEVILTKISTND